MSNVSQESTAAATNGDGTGPIMREGVIADNQSW